MARANGGRLDRPTGNLGMVHVLARGEGEAGKPEQDEHSHEAGPPAAMQSTPIASAPLGASCSALRLRCVALRGDTASQPVSIDGAPLGRIGTASARSSALRRFFSVSYAEKGQGWLPSLKQTFWLPGERGGGTCGDVTRETMSSLFFRLSEVILSPVPLP